MLIPVHESTITLPTFWKENRTIGGNPIIQLGNLEGKYAYQFYNIGKKLFILKNKENVPCKEIYIKMHRCRGEGPQDKPILRIKDAIKYITDVNHETKLEWIRHPSQFQTSNPDEIVKTWNGSFQFKKEDPDNNINGLRIPQLGALHAISSFMTTKSNSPATVVMPTGTGKTETMIASMVYGQFKKILVIVPTDALRSQIFSKFINLGCLVDYKIIDYGIIYPRVAMLKNAFKKIDECKKLITNSNVIISTPNVINLLSKEMQKILYSECTHLFIDEAHHVGADTWREIKDNFNNKRIIQFTATPFRRDGKNLEGKIIYNYSLSEAQENNYFKHIRLFTIEEFQDEESDQVLARNAVKILRNDLKEGNDHLVMARVASINRARDILPLYKLIAPDFFPKVITSGMSKKEKKDVFDSLNNRSTRIVICVDMLGEGFDLPNLKIAAIHDTHKSFSVILQFIGRFTRKANFVGDAAAIINIADPKMQDTLQSLYAEDADWDKILRYKSEQSITHEIVLQELVESLKNHGELSQQISLWNLRPIYSAVVFRTKCNNWEPMNFAKTITKENKYWHSFSHTENVLVVVVARSEEVKWGRYREIKDHTFELLLMSWDETRKALFVHCSDYDFFNCQKLAKETCGEETELIKGDNIFRVFAGVEFPMVKNLGAAKAGTISFTMYFGPNVTDGLTLIEKNESNLSNLTGWGYENGFKVTWGCSQKKGKIWSVRSGTINDWRSWCNNAWDKIEDNTLPDTEVTKGFLRPEIITNRYNKCPIFIQWGERLISESEDKVRVVFGNTEYFYHEVDLEIANYSEEGNIKFRIINDKTFSEYELIIQKEKSDGYEYKLTEGNPISIVVGKGTSIPFDEYLKRDPVIISYVDGSFSYNNYLVKVNADKNIFNENKIIVWDWHGTNIKIESQKEERNIESIQYKVCERLVDEYKIVFDDDAAGEAADVVAIKECSDNSIELYLVHCKFSLKEEPGARIEDMYNVCGQAQKCIRWKHNGFNYLVEHLKNRENNWRDRGKSRFVKGEMRELFSLRRKARTSKIILRVGIVQPGLSKSKITEEIKMLLASTESFIKKTADANLDVFASV